MYFPEVDFREVLPGLRLVTGDFREVDFREGGQKKAAPGGTAFSHVSSVYFNPYFIMYRS
jgi:hypothetical protein